ncbi:hypothetical protein [Candidatus Magnetominusculus dajiuhuensis]|uniref:hypothetical protein n=1 Tax=Candidatus Magnetominusculus dajiuhuensis TaxID=3137712 RepID=UPI003B43276A
MSTKSKGCIKEAIAISVIVCLLVLKVGFSSGSTGITDNRTVYTHKEEIVVSVKSVKNTDRSTNNEKSDVTYMNSNLTPESPVSDNVEVSIAL